MKLKIRILSAALLLLVAVSSCRSYMPRPQVVNTTSQIYNYTRMMADLDTLSARYPGIVEVVFTDTTSQGRVLPLVTLGNPDAGRHIMVQASMHAREYMSSQLVMAMIDIYADAIARRRKIAGIRVDTVFDRVCLTILPMVNPDGVSIAQFGLDGAVTPEARAWVAEQLAAGERYDQIKSNARGVDLNRNFVNGFGQASNARSNKSFDHYPGEKPLSETESRLMMSVALMHPYECFLNYHTSGNLIYYGCGNADPTVNDAAHRLSDLISRHTGYTGYGPESAPPNGSWADEVEVIFMRPSATVELGTRNPVPIEEFDGLLRRNLGVWADLGAATIGKRMESR